MFLSHTPTAKISRVAAVVHTTAIFLLVPFGRELQPYLAGFSRPLVAIMMLLFGGWICSILIRQRHSAAIFRFFAVVAAVGAATYAAKPLAIESTHLLLYGILALLIVRSLHAQLRYRWVVAFLLANLVSVCDELLQGLHPLRFFDLRDLYFNLLGTILGLTLGSLLGSVSASTSRPALCPGSSS